MSEQNFEIKLPLFKGPFDLLLFFIERDELDIYDIPIQKITQDFLAYIQQLETLNIEIASEFIWVASRLMQIKARMLIPRPEFDDEGQEIDPREELVRHLLEYKKYKNIIHHLEELQLARSEKLKRGNIVEELNDLITSSDADFLLKKVDLYSFFKVYSNVIEKHSIRSQTREHQIFKYPYTVEEQKNLIAQQLLLSNKVSFTEIIKWAPDKIGIIFNFLAILELLKTGVIHLQMGSNFNDFWIIRTSLEN